MREMTTKEIGQRGEHIAARFLRRSGYRIVAKNRHFGRNELDIIAKNKQYIVFVEVKTRTANSEDEFSSRPSDAVDREKRQRTVRASIDYLKESYTPLCPRFDVIEVYLDRTRRYRTLKINHIIDAFSARGTIRH